MGVAVTSPLWAEQTRPRRAVISEEGFCGSSQRISWGLCAYGDCPSVRHGRVGARFRSIRAMGGSFTRGPAMTNRYGTRQSRLEADDQYLPHRRRVPAGAVGGLTMSLSRRDLVKMSVLAGAAVALPLERSVSAASARGEPDRGEPAAGSVHHAVRGAAGDLSGALRPGHRHRLLPDHDEADRSVEIVPGLKTQMWGYNGLVPGPTFRVQQGRKTVVRQINNLPPVHPVLEYVPYTSVHLHGSASLPQYDGYASDITNPGQYKDYHYPNTQRRPDAVVPRPRRPPHRGERLHGPGGAVPPASTRWSRACPSRTASSTSRSSSATRCSTATARCCSTTTTSPGFFGDVILVNGRPWPVMQVKQRKYRFRILNASVTPLVPVVARAPATPMTVIGTDGGLMPTPQPVTTLPARHGGALRGGHRLREVPDRARASSSRNVGPEEQHQLHQHRQGDGVRRGRRRLRPDGQRDPRRARPRPTPAMASRRADAVTTTRRWSSSATTASGPSTADLGRRRSPATSPRCSPTRGRRRRDLGAPQHVRRLAPPRPHPPHRLPDPRAATAGRRSRTSAAPRTSSTSARTSRCGVLMQVRRRAAASTWCTATTSSTRTTT